MKKNVLRKEFFVEIRKTLGRFISIFFIVALGVAFYSGIRASEPDMRYSGDAFFDRTNLEDIKVMGSMGLTEEDVVAISKIGGVEYAEGAYSKDVLCSVEDTEKVIHIMAQPEKFNETEVTEGRMPEKADECLADEDFLTKYHLKIGDKITVRSGDDTDLTESLATDTFTIVGAGENPQYIAVGRGTSQVGNGEVNGFLVVPDSAFQMDVFTEIYVAVEGAKDAVVFTSAYDDVVAAVKEKITGIEAERCEARKADVLAEAEEELKNAEQTISEKSDELEDAKNELTDARSQTAKKLAEAKQKLVQSEAELNQAKQKIVDGEAQIRSAKQQITEKQTSLDIGKAEYEAQVQALDSSEKELLDGEKQYQDVYDSTMQLFVQKEQAIKENTQYLQNQKAELVKQQTELQNQIAALEAKDALGELSEEEQTMLTGLRTSMESVNTGIAQLDSGLAELEAGEKELQIQKETFLQKGAEIEQGKQQLAAGREALNAVKAQLDEGQKQLDEARNTLKEKEQTLARGRKSLDAGKKQLAEGYEEYEEGVQTAMEKLDSGEQQIMDGETQLISAQQDVADAKAEIAKVENPKWYVQDRNEAVVEYEGYGENAERMKAIGQVFPVLFFLVAALISLTSMTRMVEEQRIQIGTMKALGYGKGVIAKKYISYALLAAVGGSIMGVLIGEKIFPYIIVVSYKILYTHIPDVSIPYNLHHGLMATLIAVCCILAATIFACYKEFMAQPAELMRPPAPKVGKRILLERIPIVWKHLNFTWKSSVRNLFRYKKRFFMTVFGISGSMALMLVGFGLKECIYDVATIQYNEIQFYDAAVYTDDKLYPDEQKDILNELENQDALEAYMQGRMQKVDVKSDTGVQSLYLTVPEDGADLDTFFSFHSRTSDDVYSLEKSGVIITEKVADMLNVSVGDSITIEDEDKGEKEVQIQAICENYLGHYLYMSEAVYEELYQAKPRYNCIMYKVKDGKDSEIAGIGEQLLKFDSVLNVSYTEATKETLDGMLETLNLVTIVLIISAGMLAFVVLYNLNTINIAERKRELATLKVLGFYDGEVSSYVFRENVILTFIGVLVGAVLGKFLHRFIIVTVEVSAAMFGRVIHPLGYLYAGGLTVLFSMMINWLMHYKLKKIDMVESLKSVE